MVAKCRSARLKLVRGSEKEGELVAWGWSFETMQGPELGPPSARLKLARREFTSPPILNPKYPKIDKDGPL